jgi:exosortase/archaeosortase family protein
MAVMINHRKYYVLAFFALFIVLYAVYTAVSGFIHAYYVGLAWSVCWLLGWFDTAVTCSENYLLYEGIRELVVVEGCDGITFIALIFAAVLPFPAAWKSKLVGLAWIVPALLIGNWLRLVALTAIKFYTPAGFDFFHVYVFQPVMIAFTLLIFLAWLRATNHAAEPA